ncbi:MAG: glycerol-3-phosphate 1-O-acyltransferase PlsY [Clostridia bacterium]|nr:glycerol-3-phosphate 1-O-acyltransferase PlsY [Clostridia bacterium]
MDTVWLFLQKAWLPLLITAVVAYLLGSLNFAIIVTKIKTNGKDIRDEGSGNAGATNVLRSHGKAAALLTTLGDLAKSFAAVLLAGYVWFPLCGVPEYARFGAYLAGLACILGHLYPLYFGFRGGKGVMATLGMMLVLDWRVALISLGVFIILVLIFRMVSLGSIFAAATMAVTTFIMLKYVDGVPIGQVGFCTAIAVLIAAILIMKHSDNIKRILNGTERKLGQKKDNA